MKSAATLLLIVSLFLFSMKSMGQNVTVFENANYQGQSKTFTVGDYRIENSNDFQKGISSIKIAEGLGVIIYERSNAFGGYGISADLLEDHADFINLNFSEKIPYIRVFSTIRPGYFWKRNCIKEGEFIAGHWELNRATGNPIQNFAIVSPPIPAKTGIGENGVDPVPTSLTIPDAPGRHRPNAQESEIGLDKLIIDAPGMQATFSAWLASVLAEDEFEAITFDQGPIWGSDNLDVNRLMPQHRSVGETTAQSLPKKSYEILEGVVTEADCQVANSDFPMHHYTHDAEFTVKPKPEFDFLLAEGGDPRQTEIAVEWESGLGSSEDAGVNPAVPYNATGQSFGFCSEGHRRKDVIWNWASPGDSVHVEGIWIWERGHLPSHTEIHPPHFMAIKRHLPVSFSPSVGGPGGIIISNVPTDKFFGTRIDVFASGDGSTMWNSKGLAPFAQVIEMDRKDYVFTFSTLFSKPNPTARLAWQIKYQPGNNFITPLEIKELSNGLIQVTVPWKTAQIKNDIKLACTIVAYWDAAATKGITKEEAPMLFEVNVKTLRILDNGDGDGIPGVTFNEGECILFANIGSEWICLNEFIDIGSQKNILEHGLGNTNDDENWTINKKIKFYVMKGDKFRVQSTGWERDYIDGSMGNIISEYDRDKLHLKAAMKNLLNLEALASGKVSDDPMGETNRHYVSTDFPVNMTRWESPSTKAPEIWDLPGSAVFSSRGNYKFTYSVKRVN